MAAAPLEERLAALEAQVAQLIGIVKGDVQLLDTLLLGEG